METARTILQIIPAGSWGARFDSSKRPPPPNAKRIGNAGFYAVPLACWALVEYTVARAVVGMIEKSGGSKELGFADEEPGFSGYQSN